MSTEPKSNHDEEAQALLLEQLKDKQDFIAFLSIYIAHIQGLENVLDDVLTQRWIDEAIGSQLDVLGAIVGIAREGREDETYRVRIKAQIRINFASGIAQDFFDVFTILLGTDATIQLTDYPPAAFIAELSRSGGGGLIAAEAAEVGGIFRQLRGAGIDGQLIFSTEDSADTFTFASGSSEETSSTQGFSDNDENGVVGGVFATVEI